MDLMEEKFDEVKQMEWKWMEEESESGGGRRWGRAEWNNRHWGRMQ